MSSPILISDDDDSIEMNNPDSKNSDMDSSDATDKYCTSDSENELPTVNLQKQKSDAIKNLFPTPKKIQEPPALKEIHVVEGKNEKTCSKTVKVIPIEGVKVNLPVNPYGCQVALMSKVITAIKKSQNCLLESPTGSGKTLALLCGALAWQQHETDVVCQQSAQRYFSDHPELKKLDGVTEYISSPKKNQVTPEKFFSKTAFGEKSIYDQPSENGSGDGPGLSTKRQEPLQDSFEESKPNGQVNIHKKRKLDTTDQSENAGASSQRTPTKTKPVAVEQETPQKLRNLYKLVENLQIQTSLFVDSSVPTIFYGARTHKQIEQVVKEFSRTSYGGVATMSILSSRDYSCVREFDKQMWGTKNEMCRGCVKVQSAGKKKDESNCKYYDNRAAINHRNLPPVFDLEDLLAFGKEKVACPYYGARAMATVANIVFCPYNYLIEPSIRSNMKIDLSDNIVIIDEGHNIENICRDSATFVFTQEQIVAAIKELEIAAQYRYANEDSSIDALLKTLKDWEIWFENQKQLVLRETVNNNEATFMWQIEHFVETLNNHNIGLPQYNDFKQNAMSFCQKLRDDPRTMTGITQSSGSLFDGLDTALGYLFLDDCKYLNDFKPALVRTIERQNTYANNWRNSQFNKSIRKESLSLRLICLNPAVVFEGIKNARCIILASGTLTPLISLYSELNTEFPLKISPNHVIPQDRVWIGTLTTCPDGRQLKCRSSEMESAYSQDALGETILHVCKVTPNGVLCFLPSYDAMNKLIKRWRETGTWKRLSDLKHVFQESRNVKDHNDIMEDYYKYVMTTKGAILLAVFRGKVSEGMDFKDHQARAVVTIGIPYPNTYDMAVKEKQKYNDKYSAKRNLLSGAEWLRVQAYRALNQAVGRCVRHRGDWGAVLMVDARFTEQHYTEHLSKWVRNFLGHNHHTFQSLLNGPHNLETFMQHMTISEYEDI